MQVLEMAIQIGTLISVAVAAAGLFFAVWSYRRQMNAQVFLAYTDRFEKIMEEFPEDAKAARLELAWTLPGPSNEMTFCALKYFNLCSEEFYLYRRGYLAKDVWSIWESEMQRMLASPLLSREWLHLKHEFSSAAEFAEYVEQIHKENKHQSPTGFKVSVQPPSVQLHTTWYYTLDGKEKLGPYSLMDLNSFAKCAKVQAKTMVWKVGSPKWVEAEKVPGIL